MPYRDKTADSRWRANRYHARRAALVASLGGACIDCGCHTLPLEFDHVVERTWSNRRVGGLQRIRLYEREALRGEIVLRCAPCHDLRHNIITAEEAAARRARALNVDCQQMELAGAMANDDDNRPF